MTDIQLPDEWWVPIVACEHCQEGTGYARIYISGAWRVWCYLCLDLYAEQVRKRVRGA